MILFRILECKPEASTSRPCLDISVSDCGGSVEPANLRHEGSREMKRLLRLRQQQSSQCSSQKEIDPFATNIIVSLFFLSLSLLPFASLQPIVSVLLSYRAC
eukprot:m.512161 g.512161  ORF g.512161 m.512161 type:complete len:102 (+) comp57434_c0_seq47:888-1193(+)